MSNALRWLPQIESGAPIREAFSDVPIATNDPRDIAAVGAVCLLADEPETRAYRITGPKAQRAAERVAILSEVLGRELPFEPLSNEEAREQMSASMPDAYVDAFFDFFVEGSIDETTSCRPSRRSRDDHPGPSASGLRSTPASSASRWGGGTSVNEPSFAGLDRRPHHALDDGALPLQGSRASTISELVARRALRRGAFELADRMGFLGQASGFRRGVRHLALVNAHRDLLGLFTHVRVVQSSIEDIFMAVRSIGSVASIGSWRGARLGTSCSAATTMSMACWRIWAWASPRGGSSISRSPRWSPSSTPSSGGTTARLPSARWAPRWACRS